MATSSVPNPNFVNGAAADADEVDANFAALVDFDNNQVVHRDGSKAMSAAFDAGSNKIVNLTAGTASTDAVNVAQIAALVPVGGLVPYAGSSAPSSTWALCDGSAVSRSTYSALFAVVGTTYGAGNGSTTFNLPDLRSRFPVGKGSETWSNALGEADGSADAVAVAHTHSFVHDHPDNLAAPAHDHSMPNAAVGSVAQTGLGNRFVTATAWDAAGTGQTGAASATALTGSVNSNPSTDKTTLQSPSASATNANLPPYITLNYIIRVV